MAYKKIKYSAVPGSKVSTQMRYDAVLYAKVQAIAETEYRSTNAQIEYFIKKGVEQYELEHGEVAISVSD